MQLERMRDEFATFVSCATNQCGMNLECAEHTYTPRHPTDVATAGIGHVERFGLWTCVVVPLYSTGSRSVCFFFVCHDTE